MADYSKDEIKRIEEKWRKTWEEKQVYKTSEDTSRPKYYVLDMFPYPSGAGLHVGHPLGYIASDIVARFKRIKGYNVLHPMGFDSFGLPAEQYAISTGQHPAAFTQKNIDTYKRQLRQIGFSFDWAREVQTSDPQYYKWTQWIFMQLFNAWYNKDNNGGKTEPLSTLVSAFEKNGTASVNAAADENTIQFTASEWKAFDEKTRELVLEQYRIAYQSETMVNWCEALGTVLSNDEVKDGVSERGGFPVERRKMLQWSMRISAYSERLLTSLDTIDWPAPLKEMQRNWIGKSVGCELDFKIADSSETIRVFTTRIDTIYGVTFMVLAPEHALVTEITTAAQRDEVERYIQETKSRTERERMSDVKRISGAFTGAFVVNPFNSAKIPVWISDYVLAGYGTGAVMGVPSSDTRDHAFAKHFGLEIIRVLEGPGTDITQPDFDPKTGRLINSGELNGLDWKDALIKALERVEADDIGVRKINYRMRDAIFGRQRYWGEPFPVYFKNGLPKLVDTKDLPVTLPEVDAYKPTATGEPPLARAKDWKYQGQYSYELTTMPGWAGSSWYWFRYMDPQNKSEFVSKEKESYWKSVDLYIGGSEHATGHLLYSRFWCKALKDLGYVDAEEPFNKLINQGHIQGVSKLVYRLNGTPYFISKDVLDKFYTSSAIDLAYIDELLFNVSGKHYTDYTDRAMSISTLHVDVSLVEDDILDTTAFKTSKPDFSEAEFILNDNGKYVCGSQVEKMSKSLFNVINPDEIIERYGADTLRLYEMFLGPLEQSKPWNTNGIDGVYKFLRKLWSLFHDEKSTFRVTNEGPSKEELKALHKTLKKVESDIEGFSFNTTVSEFMICVNELTSLRSNKRQILEPLVIALSPFAPHICEELWEKLGHTDTILKATFVQYEEQYLRQNSFEYPISINGKVRTMINFPLDMPKEDIEKMVMASEIVLKWSEGKAPKKVIIVPGKIVNVVL